MGLFSKRKSEDQFSRLQRVANERFPMYSDFEIYFAGDQEFLILTNNGLWLLRSYLNNPSGLYPYRDIINYSFQISQFGSTYLDVVFNINVGNNTIETRARIRQNERDILVHFLNSLIQDSRYGEAEAASNNDMDDSYDGYFDLDHVLGFSVNDLDNLKGKLVKDIVLEVDDDYEKVIGFSLRLGDYDNANGEAMLRYFFDGQIKLEFNKNN